MNIENFNLKEWRKTLQWTQQNAADVLGMSRRAYLTMEKTNVCSTRTVYACKYLNSLINPCEVV